MTDVMSVARDLSNPVKIGWMVWLAWGFAQWAWRRHACAAGGVAAVRDFVSPFGAGTREMVSLKKFLDSPD